MKFHFGWPYESGIRIDVNLNIITGNIEVTQNNRPTDKIEKNKVRFTDENNISHILEIKNRFFLNPKVFIDGYEIVVFRKLQIQNIISVFFPVLILFNIFNWWSAVLAIVLTLCGMYANLSIAKKYVLYPKKSLIFCILSAVAFIGIYLGLQYLILYLL